jgi:wobble nucleotide-excising tRNase
MEALERAIDRQTKSLSNLADDIRSLEGSLSQDAKGAQEINDLLAAYFGKADLRIEVSADKRFQIIRGTAVAKNLSEGERAAIAFAYFITRVHDGRVPLSETTVVVDDPVSSLDANHLFNTYALVKTRLAGSRQLFVVTHNFEFYNLVREWVFEDEKKRRDKPQNDWKMWSVFLVRRVDNETAAIEEIPKELLTFKSEYHYLFSKLYRFDIAGSCFDDLLSLPNVIRRFMEAFGGIMIPLSTGLGGKMERLFPNEIERERVWKFINHYSHNTTITRSLTIPDTSECRAVVKACLEAVRNWDAQYFADLESEVGASEDGGELEGAAKSMAVPG